MRKLSDTVELVVDESAFILFSAFISKRSDAVSLSKTPITHVGRLSILELHNTYTVAKISKCLSDIDGT